MFETSRNILRILKRNQLGYPANEVAKQLSEKTDKKRSGKWLRKTIKYFKVVHSFKLVSAQLCFDFPSYFPILFFTYFGRTHGFCFWLKNYRYDYPRLEHLHSNHPRQGDCDCSLYPEASFLPRPWNISLGNLWLLIVLNIAKWLVLFLCSYNKNFFLQNKTRELFFPCRNCAASIIHEESIMYKFKSRNWNVLSRITSFGSSFRKRVHTFKEFSDYLKGETLGMNYFG